MTARDLFQRLLRRTEPEFGAKLTHGRSVTSLHFFVFQLNREWHFDINQEWPFGLPGPQAEHQQPGGEYLGTFAIATSHGAALAEKKLRKCGESVH